VTILHFKIFQSLTVPSIEWVGAGRPCDFRRRGFNRHLISPLPFWIWKIWEGSGVGQGTWLPLLRKLLIYLLQAFQLWTCRSKLEGFNGMIENRDLIQVDFSQVAGSPGCEVKNIDHLILIDECRAAKPVCTAKSIIDGNPLQPIDRLVIFRFYVHSLPPSLDVRVQ
jgi:hypothetical protein